MKHYTGQEIEDAIKRAPKFIQDEISSGEDTAIIIAGIGRLFGLHIDVVGLIAELNRNMLLGLVGPEEFLKELIAAKVPEKDAREIMTEINQKIFVPLREEMRKGAESAPPAPKAAATQSHFHLENKISLPPQPNRSVSHKPALRDVLASVMRASPDANNVSVESHKLLADHEESHIEFGKLPSAPPENLTGATRVPQAASTTPAPESRTKPPKQSAPATLAKSYSVDPYREPLDEK